EGWTRPVINSCVAPFEGSGRGGPVNTLTSLVTGPPRLRANLGIVYARSHPSSKEGNTPDFRLHPNDYLFQARYANGQSPARLHLRGRLTFEFHYGVICIKR